MVLFSTSPYGVDDLIAVPAASSTTKTRLSTDTMANVLSADLTRVYN